MLPFRKKRQLAGGFTGLGIHPDGVSMVCVAFGNGHAEVVTAWEFRLWNEFEPREDLLRRLAEDYKLEKGHCVTFLEPSEYRLLLAERPDVPPEEIKEAVRWRIQEVVDFDVSEATVDVFPFPSHDGSADPKQTYVIAAQNKAVKERVHFLEGAGAHLEVIDIPELALRNIAARLPRSDQGVALLCLTNVSVLLVLVKGNCLYMSRSLSIGLDEMTHAEKRGVYLEQIILEVQRSLDYYVSHFKQSPIEHLFLGPLPDGFPGLNEFFSERLGIAVSFVDMLKLVGWQNVITPVMEHKCFLTLGAALRDIEYRGSQ